MLTLLTISASGLVSVALFLAFGAWPRSAWDVLPHPSSIARLCCRLAAKPTFLIADGCYPPPYPAEPGLSSACGAAFDNAG